MAKKEFRFHGKTEEEVKQMSLKEFAELLPSRQRRSLLRGRTEAQKKVLERIKNKKKIIKTHAREMIITPDMLGTTIKVYSGKEWVSLDITKDILGYRLGEFVPSRKRVGHSSPGVGATRSSSALSVR